MKNNFLILTLLWLAITKMIFAESNNGFSPLLINDTSRDTFLYEKSLKLKTISNIRMLEAKNNDVQRYSQSKQRHIKDVINDDNIIHRAATSPKFDDKSPQFDYNFTSPVSFVAINQESSAGDYQINFYDENGMLIISTNIQTSGNNSIAGVYTIGTESGQNYSSFIYTDNQAFAVNYGKLSIVSRGTDIITGEDIYDVVGSNWEVKDGENVVSYFFSGKVSGFAAWKSYYNYCTESQVDCDRAHITLTESKPAVAAEVTCFGNNVVVDESTLSEGYWNIFGAGYSTEDKPYYFQVYLYGDQVVGAYCYDDVATIEDGNNGKEVLIVFATIGEGESYTYLQVTNIYGTVTQVAQDTRRYDFYVTADSKLYHVVLYTGNTDISTMSYDTDEDFRAAFSLEQMTPLTAENFTGTYNGCQYFSVEVNNGTQYAELLFFANRVDPVISIPAGKYSVSDKNVAFTMQKGEMYDDGQNSNINPSYAAILGVHNGSLFIEKAFYISNGTAEVTNVDGKPYIVVNGTNTHHRTIQITIGNSCGTFGSCGADNNINWTFSENGVLTIKGTGNMDIYSSKGSIPWFCHKDIIDSVIIESQITSISNYAFFGCYSLKSIVCYNSIPPKVDKTTFENVSKKTKIYVPADSYDLYKTHEIWGQFDVQKISDPDVGNGDDDDPTGNNNDNTPQIITIYQDCSLNPVVQQDNPHDVLSNLRFTRASVSYSYNQNTHQPTEVVSDTFDIFTVTTTGESVKGCIITATINLFSEGFGYNDDAELSGPKTGYIMSIPGYIAYADYGMNPNLSDGNQGKIFTKPEDHIVKPAGLWKTSDEIDSNTMIAGRIKNEASYLAHVKTAVDAVATEDWDTWGAELLNALDEGLSGGMLWEYNYSESWGDYAPTYIPTALVTSVIVQIEKGNDTYMYNINGIKATIKPLKLTNIGDDFYIPLGVTTQLDGNGNRVVTSNYIEFEEEINYFSTTKNASFVSRRDRNIPSIEATDLKKLIGKQFINPILYGKGIDLHLTKNRRNLPAVDKSVVVIKSEGCDSYNEALVESGSMVNIKAVPMDGYTFSHWSDGNTDNPRTLTITNDVTYTVTFESIENVTTYTITWQDEDGNVIKTDQVVQGTTPAFTGTTPTKEGYTFAGWLPNIKPATKDMCYFTYFIPAQQQESKVYTVNINGENCSLNINNQYPEGTVITLEAVADECFEFRQWSDGNKENPRTVTVTKDMSLTAEFNKVRYTVTGEPSTDGKVQIRKQ